MGRLGDLFKKRKKKTEPVVDTKKQQEDPDVTKEQEVRQRQMEKAQMDRLILSMTQLKTNAAQLKNAEDRGQLESLRRAYDNLNNLGNSFQTVDPKGFENASLRLGDAIREADNRIQVEEVKAEYAALAADTAYFRKGQENRLEQAKNHLAELKQRKQLLGIDDGDLAELETRIEKQLAEAPGKIEADGASIYAREYSRLTSDAKEVKFEKDRKRLEDLSDTLKTLDKVTKDAFKGKKEPASITQMRAELNQQLAEAKNRIDSNNESALLAYYQKMEKDLNGMGAAGDQLRLDSFQELFDQLEKKPGSDKETVRNARQRVNVSLSRNQYMARMKTLGDEMDKIKKAEHADVYKEKCVVWAKMKQEKVNVPEAGKEDITTLEKEVSAKVESAGKRVNEDRKSARVRKYKELIISQRRTPLETLINKVKTMDVNAARPEAAGLASDTIAGTEVKSSTMLQDAKGRVGRFFQNFTAEKLKEGAKEFFIQDWGEQFRGLMDGASGKLGDILGLTDDIGDIGGGMEAAEALAGKKKFSDTGAGQFTDSDAGSIVGAVAGLLSGALHLFGLVKKCVEMYKADQAGTAEHPVADKQDRWNRARDVMHDLVDLFKDGIGIAEGFIDAIPLLGPVLNIIQGGLGMTVDVADMITNSVHIEMMRRDRNRIYKRIQEKHEKYSSGEKADADAAAAYNVGRQRYSAIDTKRRELMQAVALKSRQNAAQGQNQNNTVEPVRILTDASMRSRNDSRYREAQYGLGQRILARKAQGASKSEIRQMEALEMMEQYRELDKSHKKMRKALYHNIEAIIRGATGLIGNGLKLAGQIAAMTGVGVAAGAGLIGASTIVSVVDGGYGLARDAGASAYKGARTLFGTEANKASTREDMAIVMMDRMKEIAESDIWLGDRFKDSASLDQVSPKAIVREGENVHQMHSVLRRGLDVQMPELIASADSAELKEKLASAFSQG